MQRQINPPSSYNIQYRLHHVSLPHTSHKTSTRHPRPKEATKHRRENSHAKHVYSDTPSSPNSYLTQRKETPQSFCQDEGGIKGKTNMPQTTKQPKPRQYTSWAGETPLKSALRRKKRGRKGNYKRERQDDKKMLQMLHKKGNKKGRKKKA